MKKIFSIVMLMFAAMSFLTSCDSDTDIEAGGTIVEPMAGLWEVNIDAVDENGKVVYEDFFDPIQLYTYNTASNSSTQMWIDDKASMWAYKFLVNIDLDNMTFSSPSTNYDPTLAYSDEGEAGNAVLENGKIVKNGGLNIHGKPIDSIEFYISFDDDDYPSIYGFAKYHVHGIRYSGFYE